ncbi:hypothetical protein QQS21_003152 [Conoideocrella luteorostrata]|uniref:UbiA prenyltransferase n=1 Tax=Conoideocrella luteorostrata TaxID=1105319 RepID=A0AAJ0CWE6_9HYPO|nr:hypothetical protein QQS21_003152 [Conoideocrella luteorostrata]
MASMFCKGTDLAEVPAIMASSLVYVFLYAYNIDIANNIAGSIEDEINKPDRPIAAKTMSLNAAKTRYFVSTAAYILYSYYTHVLQWSLLWIITIFSSYMLHTSKFGPTKDLSMSLGTVAQLMAAWELGGSPSDRGQDWVKTVSIGVFFTVSIQDFRDVPGDLASGRLTMPILLGDPLGRTYAVLGLIIFQPCPTA